MKIEIAKTNGDQQYPLSRTEIKQLLSALIKNGFSVPSHIKISNSKALENAWEKNHFYADGRLTVKSIGINKRGYIEGIIKYCMLISKYNHLDERSVYFGLPRSITNDVLSVNNEYPKVKSKIQRECDFIDK